MEPADWGCFEPPCALGALGASESKVAPFEPISAPNIGPARRDESWSAERLTGQAEYEMRVRRQDAETHAEAEVVLEEGGADPISEADVQEGGRRRDMQTRELAPPDPTLELLQALDRYLAAKSISPETRKSLRGDVGRVAKNPTRVRQRRLGARDRPPAARADGRGAARPERRRPF